MMITRGGGRRWRQPGSAQMHEKRACIEIMQRSSLTVEVLITSPLNAFCQSSVCKVLLLFLFQSLAMCRGFRHPEALNTCCHFSRILTELVSSQGEQNFILTAVLTKLWFNSSIHGEKNKQNELCRDPLRRSVVFEFLGQISVTVNEWKVTPLPRASARVTQEAAPKTKKGQSVGPPRSRCSVCAWSVKCF